MPFLGAEAAGFSAMKCPVKICGAGPAGMAAALGLARRGRAVVIHERRADVGGRFHGDFQGLENWTTGEDVLEVLEGMGMEINFQCTPFSELVLFDPRGREALCRASRPLFYLVRRGNQPGMLDHGLKQQIQALDQVRIHFRSTTALERGDIMAAGPRGGNIIALGYVFETDMADGVFAAVSNELAPHGYAYLLVQGGRGTLAACLFSGFGRGRECLARCVDFFRERAGLRMKHARRFGGVGTAALPDTACPGGVLHVGEAAGFQDALFGFGIRYALMSGCLAAEALGQGGPRDYERLWREKLGGFFRSGAVNRWLFENGGHAGYRYLVWRVCMARDPRAWLRRFYAPSWLKSAWYRCISVGHET